MLLSKETGQVALHLMILPILTLVMVAVCCIAGAPEQTQERGQSRALAADVSQDIVLEEYLVRGCTITCSLKRTPTGTVIHGPFQVVGTNGTLILKGTYKEGKWDGEVFEFHGNGSLRSRGRYQDGKEDGTFLECDDSGRIVHTVAYSLGKKQGAELHLGTDGEPKSRLEWRSGILSSIEWFEGGKSTKKLTGAEAEAFMRKKAIEAAKRAVND